MMNFMKSEWYRIAHTSEIYWWTGIMAGLLLCMNIVLSISDKRIPDFPYGTVRFSMSSLSAGMTILMVVGAILASVLFSGDKKYGTMKNTVASGIPREKIFLGKCLVTVGTAFISMVIILMVYIGSACLLLKGPGTFAVTETLKGVGATLLCAVASAILEIVLIQCFEKDVMAVIGWFAVMFLIPKFCFFVGLKIDLFNRIASWMPWNFLDMEVLVNMSEWRCLWDTPEGLGKCLIAGAVGIVVFLTAGLVLTRKQEI